ncbi:MAG: hypothetical protein MJ089_07160 [Ruminococcus sp.]|nr:hypothetical protein [Ruminococcus sp.]
MSMFDRNNDIEDEIAEINRRNKQSTFSVGYNQNHSYGNSNNNGNSATRLFGGDDVDDSYFDSKITPDEDFEDNRNSKYAEEARKTFKGNRAEEIRRAKELMQLGNEDIQLEMMRQNNATWQTFTSNQEIRDYEKFNKQRHRMVEDGVDQPEASAYERAMDFLNNNGRNAANNYGGNSNNQPVSKPINYTNKPLNYSDYNNVYVRNDDSTQQKPYNSVGENEQNTKSQNNYQNISEEQLHKDEYERAKEILNSSGGINNAFHKTYKNRDKSSVADMYSYDENLYNGIKPPRFGKDLRPLPMKIVAIILALVCVGAYMSIFLFKLPFTILSAAICIFGLYEGTTRLIFGSHSNKALGVTAIIDGVALAVISSLMSSKITGILNSENTSKVLLPSMFLIFFALLLFRTTSLISERYFKVKYCTKTVDAYVENVKVRVHRSYRGRGRGISHTTYSYYPIILYTINGIRYRCSSSTSTDRLIESYNGLNIPIKADEEEPGFFMIPHREPFVINIITSVISIILVSVFYYFLYSKGVI